MDIAALVLFAAALIVTWACTRIGIWIGGNRTARFIVEGFLKTAKFNSKSEEVGQIEASLNLHRPWFSILGGDVKNSACESRSCAIGEALASAGISSGIELQRLSYGPKKNEAEVRLDRTVLKDVAWLADYGLRVWMTPYENEIRRGIGQRLERDRAEKLSGVLDSFERQIALSPLFSESEEDRERRFFNYENRMKRIWECYDPDWPKPRLASRDPDA